MKIDLQLDQLWVPKPTQAKFFQAIGEVPDMGMVAYVGSLGSGKTWALCRAALGLSLNYPGIKVLLGRFHGTDLRDTTQTQFFGLVTEIEEQLRIKLGAQGEQATIGQHRIVDKVFQFNNGSQVLFRPLEEAAEKYKSLEIAAFGIDEASEVPAESVMMLQARCRQRGYPHVGFMVSNPTSYDHWLYEWFVRSSLPGHVIFRTNTLENRDNLPANYIENLRAKYPPDWIRRYLEGEWGGLTEGTAVFPTFTPSLHVKPLTWTVKRPVLVGIDFGWKWPGVVWGQIDPTNRLKVLRSWHPTEISAHDLAIGIKKRNDVWFPLGGCQYYAGHDGNTKKDTGEKTSAEIFQSFGMNPVIRYTAIERGLSIIRDLMTPRDDGEPALLVDPSNQRMIEGFLGGYQYLLEREEIKKSVIYNCLFDAMRYIAVNNYDVLGPLPKKIPAFRQERSWRQPRTYQVSGLKGWPLRGR